MNGLLVCTGFGKYKNIGDYIQTVAQEQFFETTDCYVERERLNTFKSGNRVRLIMNGWFMWEPDNFPPSDDIDPLFISFHIVPRIAEKLLTPQSIAYLKKYEPIGARDYNTKKILEEHGIKSYFSGCLTLTLGLKYKSSHQRDNQIYFVDPYYEIGGGKMHNSAKRFIIAFGQLIRNYRVVKKVNETFVPEWQSPVSRISEKLDHILMAASFYDTYSKVFSDDMLLHAHYIKHNLPQSMFDGDDDKMQCARDLILKYARAKMVITSRIHCALPCLGLETPVIFVTSEELNGDNVRSAGRFDGLLNLMHTMTWTPRQLMVNSSELKDLLKKAGKIGRNTDFINPANYEEIKNKLIDRVTAW